MNQYEYFKFLAPQWHDLIFKFDVKYARHFRRISGSLFSMLANRWPELTLELFTMPIIKNLFKIEITSKEFCQCLVSIHGLFVESTEPSWTVISQIPVEIIEFLFLDFLVCFCRCLFLVFTLYVFYPNS